MHRPVVDLKPQRDGREVLICRLRLRRLSKRDKDKAQTGYYYLQEEEERTTASSDDDTDTASDAAAAAARRSQDVRRHVVQCLVGWGPPGLALFLRLRGDTLLAVNPVQYPSSVGK